MSANRTTAEIDMDILKISVFSMPGPILIALGLIGTFGEPDEIPFQFLNSNKIVNLMLVFGLAISLLASVVLFKLLIEKAKNRRQNNS